MRLAPTAHMAMIRELAVNHQVRHLAGALDQGAGRGVQGLALHHGAHVVLHVLSGPAAGVGDVGELRELYAKLGEEAEELAGDGLHVVLAAGDDEAGGLVLEQVAVGEGLLVLDTVHALDHLVVQTRRGAPADGRGDEVDVGPVHQGLVDRL